ncbi:tRNA dihydrouridine(20/20a) synthase DusA [Rhodovibrionaceae bacterium A322]
MLKPVPHKASQEALPDASLPGRRLSVAPMMDWTDRHCRYFLRLISRQALLYTEMVTTGAVLYGPRHRFLRYDTTEHPVALQLGGSDPEALHEVSAIADAYGYDEINLNVGCPSDRVQSGRFGACLMAEPELVRDCIEAMGRASKAPVTVKSRIGIDDQEDYEDLVRFIETVAQSGCRSFTVHARKAWLQGLSPKQNREIPPLRYELVHRLKADYPQLEIIINGGFTSLEMAEEHLAGNAEGLHLDGVMIGRAAYQTPYLLADVDQRFFGSTEQPRSREAVAEAFVPYVRDQMEQGVPLKSMTRHILGLFNGLPGAKAWRRHLSEEAHLPGAGAEVILDALARWQETQARKRVA